MDFDNDLACLHEQIYASGMNWALTEYDADYDSEFTEDDLRKMREDCFSAALENWPEIDAKIIREDIDEGLKDGGFPMWRIF